MLELLFLLLPIAVGYGWYMGRRSVRQDTQKQSNQFSRQYVAGLNYLLSDESDKAVDLFIQLLEVDSETIETHLSLGNLFRQRGEVDRAIKIHQNLITRQLTMEQRQLALQELARDFLAAGLLDRAEKLWLELTEDGEYEETALAQLQLIYQQLRDWEKAIAVSERLQKFQGKKLAPTIAHYQCELADMALREENRKQAQLRFRKALTADGNCVRASLGLGWLAKGEGDPRQAAREFERVLTQDIDFASEVLEPLCESLELCGEEARIPELLGQAQEARAGFPVTLRLADYVERHNGREAASELVLRQLRRTPSLRGFQHLMALQLRGAEEGQAKESLTMLKALVDEQIKIKSTHKCRQCGFATHSLFWQCPSCRQWGAIKPIRGLDGE